MPTVHQRGQDNGALKGTEKTEEAHGETGTTVKDGIMKEEPMVTNVTGGERSLVLGREIGGMSTSEGHGMTVTMETEIGTERGTAIDGGGHIQGQGQDHPDETDGKNQGNRDGDQGSGL